MNIVGTRTLLRREILRFILTPGLTFTQPLMTALLYFAIFGAALGSQLPAIHGVGYPRFITSGLVMLMLLQSSYVNTSTSLILLKLQKGVIDLLVAPLSALETIIGFVGGSIVRGLLTGGLVWLVSAAFTEFGVAHPGWALLFMLLGGASFGLLGLGSAIVAQRMDALQMIPALVITPMTFLGGVFYDVGRLPSPWDTIASLNPVLYLVEGLRFGILGRSGQPVWLCLAVACALLLVIFAVIWGALIAGYKLRE